MTIEDFSNEFDVLMNSWTFPIQQGNAMSPVALNEYEKSIYLTRAQDDIIKSYFSPALNAQREGLGTSRKRDIDFSNIIITKSLAKYDGGDITKFNDNGELFKFPSEEILLYLNEACTATKGGTQVTLTVVPLSQDEYERVTLRPYRFPYKRQAWRLIHSNTDGTSSAIEVIPGFGYTDVSYKCRYVRYPSPIILEDLSGSGLEIRGESGTSECELSEEIHTEILARAVELAKAHVLGSVSQVTQATNPGGKE